jgi:hypothetical protein
MKAVAKFLSRKVVRNAAIVLAIALVAYVVMYGVREGFQNESSIREYKFDVYKTLSSNPLLIPEKDYKDKTIKNIKLEVWAPATAGASTSTPKEYIYPKFVNTAGGGNLINRTFAGSQAAVYSKGGGKNYNIRGNNYTRRLAANDIVLGPSGIKGDDPKLMGGIFVFIDKSYANMAGNNTSNFEDRLYNAKVTLEFM